jgi:hypothetical protein
MRFAGSTGSGVLEDIMRKTDPQTRKPNTADSLRPPSGLIAKATHTQSAGPESFLDNRSHRTADGFTKAREPTVRTAKRFSPPLIETDYLARGDKRPKAAQREIGIGGSE